jgi:hypothetical protein
MQRRVRRRRTGSLRAMADRIPAQRPAAVFSVVTHRLLATATPPRAAVRLLVSASDRLGPLARHSVKKETPQLGGVSCDRGPTMLKSRALYGRFSAGHSWSPTTSATLWNSSLEILRFDAGHFRIAGKVDPLARISHGV